MGPAIVIPFAAQSNLPSLPLYPECRPCTRPTTQILIELFTPIQRHEVQREADCQRGEQPEPLILVTTLTPLQRKIVQLLGLKPADYGR